MSYADIRDTWRLPAAIGLLLMVAHPAAAQRCADAQPLVEAALAANDRAGLQAAHRALSDCPSAEMDSQGRRLAARIYNQAIAAPQPDEALLTASLEFARTWQALATLGDLAFQRKQWPAATARLQEALIEIDDKAATPSPPPATVILAMRRRAETAALLSPDYVPLPVTRSGANGGLAAGAIRGIAVTSVALPIQFQYDSDRFTANGQRAAADLARMVANDRPLAREITLIGHTDATGQAAYNEALSMKRAEAVRRFLQARGIKARIAVAGMGERRPYTPDDPGRYNAAERDQMNRRVEFRRQ
jgi:outer membrane protein OmpA-like peptidoglycan-associated protein